MKIETTTTNKEINKIVEAFQETLSLEKILIEITGLDKLPVNKLIVADSDDEIYRQTIQDNSDKDEDVTNTDEFVGVAKTICKEHNGFLETYIVIKDYVFIGFIAWATKSYDSKPNSVDTDTLASILLHEIGHAVEYQLLYEKYNFYLKGSVIYDLRDRPEEYFLDQSIALFSEYFAQLFANRLLLCPSFLVNTIEMHLLKISTEKNIVEHASRTAYMFALEAAYCDAKDVSINYENYTSIESLQSAIGSFCEKLKEIRILLEFDQLDFATERYELARCYKNIIDTEYSIMLYS